MIGDIVSGDTLSDAILVTSMGLSNTSSAKSVNSFNEDLEIDHPTTQDEIDVKDWGNSFPSLCNPGYIICIFQNIDPQPLGGYEPKAHHNKKALGPHVGLFAKHGLNKKNVDAGHTF